MPRKLTGTVEWRSGCWQAKITMPDGARPWIEMKGIARDDEAKARFVAQRMAVHAKATGAVPTERGETVSEYLDRWCTWRLAHGIASADECRSSIETHFVPKFGPLPIVSVQKTDLEDFVGHLDALVLAGENRWKTATNIWSAVSTMFRDAANAKARELRVLDTNPALGIAPPDKGDERSKQYLYPDEFLALVGCEEVPLVRARLYAVATYTYSRAGELVPLAWSDVDLVHNKIHFHQAVDRGRAPDVVKGIKTKSARRIGIEPNLRPLLVLMKQEGGVLVLPSLPRPDGEYGLANLLRRDLKAARVDRGELYTTNATRKAMTFHDLRATGTTWMAVRGDDALKIQQRAGHKSFQTTQGYIREAEVNREGFGSVFPPLPERLVGNRPNVQESEENYGKSVGAAGFETADVARGPPPNQAEPSDLGVSIRPNEGDSLGASVARMTEAVLVATKEGRWEEAANFSRTLDTIIRLSLSGQTSTLRVVPPPEEKEGTGRRGR